MKYRSDIDGLRGIAVSAVILFHAQIPMFNGGYLGVDIFFVISGFLITKLLLEANKEQDGIFYRFYERRILRIAPALAVVLMSTIVVSWFLLPSLPMRDFGKSVMAVASFSSNFLFWRESGYFNIEAEVRPLLHTWSLAVEEQFYLLYPLVLIWSIRKGLLFCRCVVVGVTLISFILSVHQSQVRPDATFFLLPTRGWELLTGASVALLPRGFGNWFPCWLRDVFGISALIAIFFEIAFIDSVSAASVWSQVSVVLATATLIFIAPEKGFTVKALSSPPFVAVGLVSYSAYLWHQPLFAFSRMYAVVPLTPFQVVGLLVITFALAALTWRFVEQPMRRRKFGSKFKLYLFTGAGSLVMGLVGLTLTSISINNWRVGESVSTIEAKIKENFVLRQAATQSGICSFNGVYGRHTIFDEFMSSWQCWGNKSNGWMILGDSHAADIAMALRSSGIEIGQMTGGGCSLVPSFMTKQCRLQFDFVLSQAIENNISTLLLANRYQPGEITDSARDEMKEFWTRQGLQIWLFTGLPEFPNQSMLLPHVLLGKNLNTVSLNADENSSRLTEEFAKSLASAMPGLKVVNTRELFCRIEPAHNCQWRVGNTELLLDGHHLTVGGANIFGKILREELEKLQ